MTKIFWIIDFIIPFTMIGLGYYYYFKKSHKPISKYSGLRTESTMSSRKNWEYAHKLSGKILIYVGIGLSIYAVIVKILKPLPAEYLSLINNAVYIIVFIAITIISNSKVKRLGE